MTTMTRTFARRAGAAVALSGLTLAATTLLFAAPASAATGPVVTLQDGTNGCNGVKATPGSENTSKTLVGGSMQPGEDAVFQIQYPVDESNVGEEFTITDCVYIADVAYQKYSIKFVPNNTAYTLSYTVTIPDTAAIGAEYCNYAKTTGGPSDPQASNRKANPACFNVGGSLRVEKRADSVDGDLLPGATFSVECLPTSNTPPVVVDGLDEAGVATTGVIGINGPEGTPCFVTELAAPDGYALAEESVHKLTIPRGSTADVDVFVNEAVSNECPEGTERDDSGQCVSPSPTPSESPSEEPTVEPSEPAPSVSPTVLGVKIVQPTLPQTGSSTVILVALGLLLMVAGGTLVVRAGRYAPAGRHSA